MSIRVFEGQANLRDVRFAIYPANNQDVLKNWMYEVCNHEIRKLVCIYC